MADKPKLRFLCTISENGQIFIPVKMREVLGLNFKDIVEFEADGKIAFCKAGDESAAEQGLEKKEMEDGKKRSENANTSENMS